MPRNNRKSSDNRISAKWYVLSLACFAIGACSATYPALGIGDIQPGVMIKGPKVEIDSAGTYHVIVFRGASKRLDAVVDQAWAAAQGAEVTVKDSKGSALRVLHSFKSHEKVNNKLAQIAEIEFAKAGEYEIKIEPTVNQLSPTLHQKTALELMDALSAKVSNLVRGLAIGGVFALVGVVIAIIVLVKRGRGAAVS